VKPVTDNRKLQVVRVPEEALKSLRAQLGTAKTPAEANIVGRQKKELIDQETNVDFVGKKGRNPLSFESQIRRQALKASLEARLTIFRDNVDAVRTANRVLNNAAIIQLMTAAETWIMDIRTMAEGEKQRVVDRAKNHLLETLEDRIVDIEVFRERGIVPIDILDVMQNNAFNDFACRAARIAELNFEFDKDKLLNIGTNERGAIVEAQR
jgi:hypothetical protein